MDLIKNRKLLKKIDTDNLRRDTVKILILDENEEVEEVLEGKTTSGSITVSGSSSVRRVGNISAVFPSFSGKDIENYLKYSRRIKILKGQGLENSDEIIWHNLGVFVLTGVSLSHSPDGVSVNLSFSDKMCLLNGQCGGVLPSSVTFHEFNQLNSKGEIEVQKQLIFNIIRSMVIFYGGERPENIIIQDVPLSIKNIVRYTGEGELFFNKSTGLFSKDERSVTTKGDWKVFSKGENVGYVNTDFVYPKELISSIGDTVDDILQEIEDTLGNYEHFYDINGCFVFREKKNYLNTSYQNSVTISNNNSVINLTNYETDFYNESKSSYFFSDKDGVSISFERTPDICKVKNDFHIWGKKKKNEEDLSVHYHIAIKEKPKQLTEREVLFNNEDGTIFLPKNNQRGIKYTPKDWRVELYLQGLEAIRDNKRPDIFQQEILDNLPTIYNFKEETFKVDLLNHPTDLSYFIDYLEPKGDIAKYAIEAVGLRTYTEFDDSVNSIYELDVPNLILLDMSDKDYSKKAQECEKQGQHYSNVSKDIFNTFSLGSEIYTGYSKARELLYEYTNLNESISISCLPIYYLEPNTRITVEDSHIGIFGDYIIQEFTLPLDQQGSMAISCNKAIERR